jgi:NAD(P)-dependent dehydrogenase (short-subunit alcohol dehydrogenase family)
MTLENKNVILTGAGRGIGREIAKKLAAEKANMVLISRTESELKETYSQIADDSPLSFYLPLDISDKNAVHSAFEQIIKRFDRIDCLINNAGIQAPIGNFILNDLNKWKMNIEINLLGAVYFSYYAVQSMMIKKKGKIINFSGGGSTSPRPAFSSYAVAKTGIVRFTETIAEELREFNIDVNAVAPGAINTGMLDEVLQSGKIAGKEYTDAILRKEKGGNSPVLVAELISFLCSDESDGITGKLISAPWDPWKTMEFQNLLKTDKDLASLRRIDNKTFYKKS